MFRVTVLSSSGFDYNQQKKLDSTVEKFEMVMNSDALKYRILNFVSPAGERFIDNMGLTNQQVFDKIYAGEENYMPGSNHTADLYVTLRQKWKPLFGSNSAAGPENPTGKEIAIYSWWFNKSTEAAIAGHLAHEWSHKIGFEHATKDTSDRKFSVPHAFGWIVEKLVEEIKD